MDANKRAVLRQVRAFAGLGDEDCDAVLAVLRARRGRAGDELFKQGDPGDSLIIVFEGALVARVRTDAGTEQEIARLGPGEVVGEMAFLDAEPRSATVATPEGATVLELTRSAFLGLRKSAPKVAAAIQRNVLIDVARRLRDAGEKLTDAAGRSSGSMRAAAPGSDARRSGRGLTIAQLRAIPALAAYSEEDLELLTYIATLRTFSAGQEIMREGTEGDACWLVVAGAVSVTRASQATPIATLGPGSLVGQLALLDRAPRSATVTATSETWTLEVRADAFANLLRAWSPVALRFQHQVALAGVRQLRAATKALAGTSMRASLAPVSGRMLDIEDWDDDEPPPDLELAVDRPSLFRR